MQKIWLRIPVGENAAHYLLFRDTDWKNSLESRSFLHIWFCNCRSLSRWRAVKFLIKQPFLPSPWRRFLFFSFLSRSSSCLLRVLYTDTSFPTLGRETISTMFAYIYIKRRYETQYLRDIKSERKSFPWGVWGLEHKLESRQTLLSLGVKMDQDIRPFERPGSHSVQRLPLRIDNQAFALSWI